MCYPKPGPRCTPHTVAMVTTWADKRGRAYHTADALRQQIIARRENGEPVSPTLNNEFVTATNEYEGIKRGYTALVSRELVATPAYIKSNASRARLLADATASVIAGKDRTTVEQEVRANWGETHIPEDGAYLEDACRTLRSGNVQRLRSMTQQLSTRSRTGEMERQQRLALLHDEHPRVGDLVESRITGRKAGGGRLPSETPTEWMAREGNFSRESGSADYAQGYAPAALTSQWGIGHTAFMSYMKGASTDEAIANAKRYHGDALNPSTSDWDNDVTAAASEWDHA